MPWRIKLWILYQIVRMCYVAFLFAVELGYKLLIAIVEEIYLYVFHKWSELNANN